VDKLAVTCAGLTQVATAVGAVGLGQRAGMSPEAGETVGLRSYNSAEGGEHTEPVEAIRSSSTPEETRTH
jgi:hypothetical protein